MGKTVGVERDKGNYRDAPVGEIVPQVGCARKVRAGGRGEGHGFRLKVCIYMRTYKGMRMYISTYVYMCLGFHYISVTLLKMVSLLHSMTDRS